MIDSSFLMEQKVDDKIVNGWFETKYWKRCHKVTHDYF